MLQVGCTYQPTKVKKVLQVFWTRGSCFLSKIAVTQINNAQLYKYKKNAKKAGHVYNTKYSVDQISGQIYITPNSDIDKLFKHPKAL